MITCYNHTGRVLLDLTFFIMEYTQEQIDAAAAAGMTVEEYVASLEPTLEESTEAADEAVAEEVSAA